MNENGGTVVQLASRPDRISAYAPKELKRALRAVCQEAYIGMPEIAEKFPQFKLVPQDFHQFWCEHIPMPAVEKAMKYAAVLVSGVPCRMSFMGLVRAFPSAFGEVPHVVSENRVMRGEVSLAGWYLASEGEFAREPGLYRYIPETTGWRLIDNVAVAAYVLVVMGTMRIAYPSGKRVVVGVTPYPGHTERFALWFDKDRVIHCEAMSRPPVPSRGR